MNVRPFLPSAAWIRSSASDHVLLDKTQLWILRRTGLPPIVSCRAAGTQLWAADPPIMFSFVFMACRLTCICCFLPDLNKAAFLHSCLSLMQRRAAGRRPGLRTSCVLCPSHRCGCRRCLASCRVSAPQSLFYKPVFPLMIKADRFTDNLNIILTWEIKNTTQLKMASSAIFAHEASDGKVITHFNANKLG